MKSIFALASALLLTSCLSTAAPIPADAAADIYFQRAQDATDQNNYLAALAIYDKFFATHPEPTHAEAFTARYEIAVLQMKLGRTALAIEAFSSIVADFDDLEKSSGAPGWINAMSSKLLQQLKEKKEVKPLS